MTTEAMTNDYMTYELNDKGFHLKQPETMYSEGGISPHDRIKITDTRRESKTWKISDFIKEYGEEFPFRQHLRLCGPDHQTFQNSNKDGGLSRAHARKPTDGGGTLHSFYQDGQRTMGSVHERPPKLLLTTEREARNLEGLRKLAAAFGSTCFENERLPARGENFESGRATDRASGSGRRKSPSVRFHGPSLDERRSQEDRPAGSGNESINEFRGRTSTRSHEDTRKIVYQETSENRGDAVNPRWSNSYNEYSSGQKGIYSRSENTTGGAVGLGRSKSLVDRPTSDYYQDDQKVRNRDSDANYKERRDQSPVQKETRFDLKRPAEYRRTPSPSGRSRNASSFDEQRKIIPRDRNRFNDRERSPTRFHHEDRRDEYWDSAKVRDGNYDAYYKERRNQSPVQKEIYFDSKRPVEYRRTPTPPGRSRRASSFDERRSISPGEDTRFMDGGKSATRIYHDDRRDENWDSAKAQDGNSDAYYKERRDQSSVQKDTRFDSRRLVEYRRTPTPPGRSRRASSFDERRSISPGEDTRFMDGGRSPTRIYHDDRSDENWDSVTTRDDRFGSDRIRDSRDQSHQPRKNSSGSKKAYGYSRSASPDERYKSARVDKQRPDSPVWSRDESMTRRGEGPSTEYYQDPRGVKSWEPVNTRAGNFDNNWKREFRDRSPVPSDDRLGSRRTGRTPSPVFQDAHFNEPRPIKNSRGGNFNSQCTRDFRSRSTSPVGGFQGDYYDERWDTNYYEDRLPSPKRYFGSGSSSGGYYETDRMKYSASNYDEYRPTSPVWRDDERGSSQRRDHDAQFNPDNEYNNEIAALEPIPQDLQAPIGITRVFKSIPLLADRWGLENHSMRSRDIEQLMGLFGQINPNRWNRGDIFLSNYYSMTRPNKYCKLCKVNLPTDTKQFTEHILSRSHLQKLTRFSSIDVNFWVNFLTIKRIVISQEVVSRILILRNPEPIALLDSEIESKRTGKNYRLDKLQELEVLYRRIPKEELAKCAFGSIGEEQAACVACNIPRNHFRSLDDLLSHIFTEAHTNYLIDFGFSDAACQWWRNYFSKIERA